MNTLGDFITAAQRRHDERERAAREQRAVEATERIERQCRVLRAVLNHFVGDGFGDLGIIIPVSDMGVVSSIETGDYTIFIGLTPNHMDTALAHEKLELPTAEWFGSLIRVPTFVVRCAGRQQVYDLENTSDAQRDGFLLCISDLLTRVSEDDIPF